MAEQIKMLFGVNTFGGSWNIVLDVGPDPPQSGERPTFKFTFKFKERRNPQAPNRSARGNKKKQMMPHRPTVDRKLEAPTAANRALGLMLILGVAVAQKDRCHLVGHPRVPKAR